MLFRSGPGPGPGPGSGSGPGSGCGSVLGPGLGPGLGSVLGPGLFPDPGINLAPELLRCGSDKKILIEERSISKILSPDDKISFNSVYDAEKKQTVSTVEEDRTIGRTLFDRLLSLGWPSVTLRTQYRCHPAIAHICRSSSKFSSLYFTTSSLLLLLLFVIPSCNSIFFNINCYHS